MPQVIADITMSLDGYVAAPGADLAPELLGGGTPLFGADPPRHLTQVAVEVSPTATHLRYRVGAPVAAD